MSHYRATPEAAHMPDESWWVRHAGRKTGPFDAVRLRTLARRGALTRFHQLSRDGDNWFAATDIRSVFNADGTVVAGDGTGDIAVSGGDRELGELGEPPVIAQVAAPTPSESSAQLAMIAGGRVSVRAAQAAAVAAVTLALAAPTSRSATGQLQWWFNDDPLVLGVCALSAVAALAWWVTLFAQPSALVFSALTAISTVLAAAAGSLLIPWATPAAPATVVLPTAALIVACESQRSPRMRGAAVVTAMLGGIALVASIGILVSDFSLWWLIVSIAVVLSMMMTVAAGAWAAMMATRVMRADGTPTRSVAALLSVSSAAVMMSLFVAAVSGLVSSTPILGARGAIAALVAAGFSVLTWVGAHGALASGQTR